jgi:hypothetical protein
LGVFEVLVDQDEGGEEVDVLDGGTFFAYYSYDLAEFLLLVEVELRVVGVDGAEVLLLTRLLRHFSADL